MCESCARIFLRELDEFGLRAELETRFGLRGVRISGSASPDLFNSINAALRHIGPHVIAVLEKGEHEADRLLAEIISKR